METKLIVYGSGYWHTYTCADIVVLAYICFLFNVSL